MSTPVNVPCGWVIYYDGEIKRPVAPYWYPYIARQETEPHHRLLGDGSYSPYLSDARVWNTREEAEEHAILFAGRHPEAMGKLVVAFLQAVP